MSSEWTPKPGDRMVRHPRRAELMPITVTVDVRKVNSRALSTPLMVIYIFAGLVGIGALLLSLPFASRAEGSAPLIDAVFTATSAVTVTGLVVEDTASYWSVGGQLILAALIFIGGLGFMTLAAFGLVVAGQRVTLSQRMLIHESLGGALLGMGHGGLVRLTMGIVTFAAATQALGFIVLAIRFSVIYSPEKAILTAMFHSVSAFNNAGFIFFSEPEGMAAFQRDGTVIGVTAAMIFFGAIGYGVLIDTIANRRFRLFGLTTKLVLIFTFLMILVGFGVFMAFEYSNQDTLGPLPVSQKITTSIFESISGRTAGFTTLDYSRTEQQTNFMVSALMFIGGASASVAGGIKVNTLAVIIVSALSTMRGRMGASAFGREIPPDQVRRALVLGAVSTAILFAIVLALSVSDGDLDFLHLFFESASAFGTVGLSAGITSELSRWGTLIIAAAMFIGRLGPFTIGIAMAQQASADRYRFAEERVTIG